MVAGTKTKKEKKRDSMSLRLPLHRIAELRAIGEREDRPVSWLIKRGIDLLIESYSIKKPMSTQTQQALVVTRQSEAEWSKARIGELEAKLERKNALRGAAREP